MASNKDTKKASTESQVKPLTGMTEREAMQRIQALSRRISEAKRQEEPNNLCMFCIGTNDSYRSKVIF